MNTRPISLFLPLLMLAACAPGEKSLDVNELDALAVRYAASWSSRDPVAHSMFYAEDGVLRINGGEPSVGRAAVEDTARSFMAGFPDMVVELVELRQVGDRVQFHWRWTGTYTGPGGNGAAVDLTGYEEWTLNADGLIRYSDGHYDEAEYQRQLSVGGEE